MRKKFAFLVGINEYQSSEIKDLNGCENDVNLIEKILGDDFEVCSLINAAANRDNIISTFQSHLGQATKDDLAFFYFSGHGSEEHSPEEFIQYQSDNKHEAIVCNDSYTIKDGKTIYGLADKETRYLINELTDKGVEVVVIYDCCHSGSGVRDFSTGTLRETKVGIKNLEERRKEDFLDGTLTTLTKEPSNALFISACKPRMKAKERDIIGGKIQGVFTYSLLKAIEKTQGNISYSNLISYCFHFIKRVNPSGEQVPGMEGFGIFDTEKIFLSDKRKSSDSPIRIVNYDKDIKKWMIAMGAIHGLNIEEGRSAKFKIFEDIELEKEICFAKIKTINIVQSTLEEIDNQELGETLMPKLNTSKIYYALPINLPIEKLHIYLNWSDEILKGNDKISSLVKFKKKLQTELNEATLNECIYSIEWTYEEDFYCMYELEIKLGQDKNKEYILKIRETQNSLLPKIKEIHSLTIAIKLLLHIAKWNRIRQLNIERSGIRMRVQKQLNIHFHDKRGNLSSSSSSSSSSSITLDYIDNKIPFKIVLENKSSLDIQCLPLYISRKFRIKDIPMDVISSNSTYTIFENSLSVHDRNINQVTDIFKFILSTYPFPYTDIGLAKTLEKKYDELMGLRDIGGIKSRTNTNDKEIEYSKQWFVKDLKIKIVRTLGVISNYVLSIANGNIVFQPHNEFKAKISLSSSADFMRGPVTDRDMKVKMELLGYELIDFSSSKNKETVLEIHHIENGDSLHNSPLTIDVKDSLVESKYCLALTLPPSFDNNENEILSGDFQVVGYLENQNNGFFRLALNSIPSNPDDGRSVIGKSLKISFIKVTEQQKLQIDNWIIVDGVGQGWLRLKKNRDV